MMMSAVQMTQKPLNDPNEIKISMAKQNLRRSTELVRLKSVTLRFVTDGHNVNVGSSTTNEQNPERRIQLWKGNCNEVLLL